YSADGKTHRIIADYPSTLDTEIDYQPADGSVVRGRVPLAFRPDIVFANDGSRLVSLSVESGATGGKYTVTVVKTNGDTMYSREYPFVETPIPPRVVDSAIAAAYPTRNAKGQLVLPPSLRDGVVAIARAKIPKVYPPVSGVVAGLDGTTWVLMRE